MRTRGLPPVAESVPNLAPLVDVVMVILIFFMLGTGFAVSEGALPSELPSDVGPGGQAVVTIVPAVEIGLVAEGVRCRLFVMERDLGVDSFKALEEYMRGKLKAGADPRGRVIIAAEPAVHYRHLISAMDACVGAGFHNVQFSVDPSGTVGSATSAPHNRPS